MSELKANSTPRKKAYFFPALIIGLLVMQIGLSLIGVYMATRSNANVVENDYYDKALHWDQQVAAEQASAALGWAGKIDISGMPDMQGNRTLILAIKDKSGAPVAGATIRMIFFHHAFARDVKSADLRDMGGGFYSAVIAAARPGLWEFRMVAQRGNEKWMKKEQIDVGEEK